MNPFKQLVLEYPFISTTISEYTSNGAAQILPKMNDAINEKDLDAVVYCLKVITDWYDRNMQAISTNHYVYNMSDHVRARNMAKELLEKLSEPGFSIAESPSQSDPMEHSPLVFLSHRSSDKKYGNAIRDFLSGLGVKNEQLIYSSHPLHKIPLDENIYDYLRKNIYRDIFMIILWSNEYLESPACMNELGAAWVVKCDYTNIYVPGFSFGNPKYHECAVDTKKMGAVLNGDSHCKQSMIELKNKIIELFDLKIDDKQLTFLLDKFIKDIVG